MIKLPATKDLRKLNKWLVGSGYQIDKPWNSYVCVNEDAVVLFRRKTLDAMKEEIENRMTMDSLSSEYDTLSGELRRLLKTHGLRPVVNQLAKALREAVALNDHIPYEATHTARNEEFPEPDCTTVYHDDMLTAAANLESDLF